jgi:hypothetical protein
MGCRMGTISHPTLRAANAASETLHEGTTLGGGKSGPLKTRIFIGFGKIVHPFCTQFWGNLETF